MSATRRIRAAIYTRKSSEEGLDQGFNSLDAQAEACAAYIASQRGEGWRRVPDRYDDGGVSGGTMDRPALKRLLADVDAGRIDMIVVYKIDRLTRSLADFARLVERLDAAGCSFVSVTQAFNTATSMGRLTLNVLLSFAQFEREVTAERIRDKIAASKKKGLWMGGLAPLGYDPDPDRQIRGLVVNEAEAECVRTLFRLYETPGCLRRAAEAAEAHGIRSKRRVFASGKIRGGNPLSRGQLHFLLTNPIYLGRIRHGRDTHPGRHPAIVDADLWERVQAKLAAASGRRRGMAPAITAGDAAGATAALTGLLVDETGDRLTPTQTTRRGRRFRYYVSRRLLTGGGAADPSAWRLPAPALERVIARGVARHLADRAGTHALLARPDAASDGALAAKAGLLVDRLEADPGAARPLLASGRIARGRMSLALDAAALGAALDRSPVELDPALLTLELPFDLRRRGVETRIVAGERQPAPDPTLIRRLREAHRWVGALRAGRSLAAIAKAEGHTPAYLRTRAPLAFLAPRIQEAILRGTQPEHLTLAAILRTGVPLDWVEQERRLGFTAPNKNP